MATTTEIVVGIVIAGIVLRVLDVEIFGVRTIEWVIAILLTLLVVLVLT